MLDIKTDSTTYFVLMGECLVYALDVRKRQGIRGKTAINNAVRVETMDPIGYRSITNTVTIQIAIGFLEKRKLPVDPFLEICKKQGWEAEQTRLL